MDNMLEQQQTESQRQQEALALCEYQALHSEIEKRIELRQQLLLGLFVIAGTFFSLGVGDVVGSGEIMLIYPILALFIGQTWSHNDQKIGEIGTYILIEVEGKYHFSGWETYRQRLHGTKHRGKKGWAPTPRMGAVFNPLNLSTRGIFLTSQLLALGIGLTRSIPTMTNVWSWVLVLGLAFTDVGAIGRTWAVVKHQREKGHLSQPVQTIPAATLDQAFVKQSTGQERVEQEKEA